MAQDAETALLLRMEASLAKFEKQMERARKVGRQTAISTERQFHRSNRAMAANTERAAKRINTALAATSTRIGLVGKAFAATAVAAGMAAITRGSTQAVRSMAELGRQAERAGLSVAAFQELRFVGEQNRIEVDAMIDGLKELQLRADEFIVTGQGPAAEAFRRLGYGASDLKRRLEEPEELFADIIGRMENLDGAAQIRVADEVFGGTAGERFVELLDQGERGIRQLTVRANELGIVIDEEAVERAAELDRKFAEVQTRIANLSKQVVVNLAGALEDAFSFDVDDIFGSAERAIAMMGEENYRALREAAAVTEDQQDNVEDLVETYEELFRAINSSTGPNGVRLMDVADLAEAQELAAILQDIDTEMQAFQRGETSAGEFEGAVSDLVAEAQDLVEGLSDVDAQRFGNVITAIGGIAEALKTAAQNAATLRENLPEGDTVTGVEYGPRNGRPNNRPPNPYAPKTSLRPRLPSVDATFGVPDTEGRGGTEKLSGFRREIERTRADIAALEQEAIALASVAASGRNVGDAMEYAAKKAELLYEAQQAGVELTPEMIAQIEDLAAQYVNASSGVDAIRERLETAQEAQEEFRSVAENALSDFIRGVADADEAIRQLILRLADLALEAALSGIFGGSSNGGVFGSIAGAVFNAKGNAFQGGRVVPFASGGVVSSPTAFPMAGRNIGLMGEAGPEAIMPLTRTANGKLGVQSEGRGGVVQVVVSVDENGNIGPFVQRVSGDVAVKTTRAGISAYDRQLPYRLKEFQDDPRRRG